MRKLLITTMALLLTLSVLTAQKDQGHRRGGDNLMSELNLSTEQQAQIKAIKDESRAQAKAFRETSNEEHPDRAARQEARKATAKKIEAVLTTEQRKQLETLKAERKTARKSVDKKALKAELKAHNDNKVKPVISAARAQFNQFISAEDQASLDRLRPVFALQPKRKAGGSMVDKKPTETEIAAKRTAIQQWKADHAAEITELTALTETYDADLKRLQERMAPQRQQWATERREIMEKHLPEGAGKIKNPKARAGKGRADADEAGKTEDRKKKRAGWPRSRAFLLLKA